MNNKINRNRNDIEDLKEEEKEYVNIDKKRNNGDDYQGAIQESKYRDNHSNIREKKTKKLYYNQNLKFLQELIEKREVHNI